MSKHWHFKKENTLFNPYGARRFFKGERQQQEEPTQSAIDPWTGYWMKISDGIPKEQISTWMKEWQKDTNFPWQQVVQDYVNVNTGEKKSAFQITEEGGLQMNYNPFSPPGGKLGKMNSVLASPFQWGEEQINQYNQNIDLLANLPLYPFAAQMVKEREAARGAGEAPIEGVNIPIGGQLLGGEASALTPESLLNVQGAQGGNPLTGTEFVMGGQGG